MAKITIDGREVEVPDGAPLVEVIKKSGTYISNLCYINGLPPYAGCRTCLVEIEGVRGLQLSCTTRVTDGMVVHVDTPLANESRKSVVSIILANHSDRCLTCHRVVKCRAGDTCLRDDVVTHRCVTCSKNYRCELQTTCDVVGMANYEPWVGEERSYYLTEPPEADRANPFLEFDPQMCILCARCVRACDEIRHTGAITVAGKGWETRIAFGAGGPVHESNCDFCGACIDLCPTATLMEHPNKWAATNIEHWTPTTCSYCSIGCTISLGSRNRRGVIVRPEVSNPVSNDQVCVRGRFHYDAVKRSEYLTRPLIRHGDHLDASTWDSALTTIVDELTEIVRRDGPQAIGFLGSPFATNEENYLLQKLARTVVGTNNVDYSGSAVPAAVGRALERSFGTQVLPADMSHLAHCKTILVVADDLESSHNVAALRIKDAVVRSRARLIVVSPRRGEMCDFAQAWLHPLPGGEAQMLQALANSLSSETSDAGAAVSDSEEDFRRALEFLKEAAAKADHQTAIVYAVPYFGSALAEAVTTLLANLALACCGPEGAPRSLYIMPSEANINGLRDMGVTPDLLPGYTAVADGSGMGFRDMITAADEGRLKALVVLGDNPLFFAPDKEWVRQALSKLDLLAVIDSLPSDTALMGHVVLPEAGVFAKDGTYTNADRRVLRLRPSVTPVGEARSALHILSDLGLRISQTLNKEWTGYVDADGVMDEIASIVPLYRGGQYHDINSGAQQRFDGLAATQATPQPTPTISAPTTDGDLLLFTGRSLYTSLEGATIHSPEADKLHKEEFADFSPQDAARLGIRDGDQITLANDIGEITLPARAVTDIAPGTVYVPLYYNGGAVTVLFGRDGDTMPQVRVSVRAVASSAPPA